jgi:serpin B
MMLLVAVSLFGSAGCGALSGGIAQAVSDKPRDPDPAVAPAEVTDLAAGNAAFAFDLYGALRGQEGNLFFSPYSISVALAMTHAGAAGETSRQMAETMHFALPAERLHAAFNAYALDLQGRAKGDAEGTPFELTVANSLWGQEGFPFLPAFLDLLAENYGAGMRLLDYSRDPEGARRTINDWVSDETRQRIKDLIPEGAINAMTRLVLANAIYFKAGWRHTFDAEATTPEPFRLLNGSSIDVPMMHQEESLGFAAGDGYVALELPYQTGDVAMVILLPDEGRFEAFEQGLSAATLDQALAGLSYQPVLLSLPKFTYESAFSLNDALMALGMPDAFDPDRADFSAMDGARDLYISNVLHKAFVAVDEKGTEAAAATAVIMEVTSAPIDQPVVVSVDRPFLYLIRDRQTGSVLFLGRVLDPSR